MQPVSISILTICGLEELAEHRGGRVTHVLSILDPEWPDPEVFATFDPHHRTILHFHDVIAPEPGRLPPEPEHVARILAFGRGLAEDAHMRGEGHLLVHCHAGVSRSTAAMAMLLAQVYPDEGEDAIMERLHAIREKAWPNLRMIGFADEQLGRGGRLVEAAARLYGRQLAVRPHLAEFMEKAGRAREVELGRSWRTA